MSLTVVVLSAMLCTEGVDTTSECQVDSDAIWQGEGFGIRVSVPRTCPVGVPSSGGQWTPYQATVNAPIDVEAEFPVDFYNKNGDFLSEALGEFGPDGNQAIAYVSGGYIAGSTGVTFQNDPSNHDDGYNLVTAGDGLQGTAHVALPFQVQQYAMGSQDVYSEGDPMTFKVMGGALGTQYEFFEDGQSLGTTTSTAWHMTAQYPGPHTIRGDVLSNGVFLGYASVDIEIQ
ncbi:MAG: hypothetical protein V4529_14480 [Gemmatimonadota bacterium]